MSETIVKHLNFGLEAKSKIFEGIEKLTKAVSSTLGASGQCVIMEDSSGNPQITKDGVTVANSIILLDPVENMGSKLLKEAARKTVTEAGDGTTTATVLAHAILCSAYKELENSTPRQIKDGINSAVGKVVQYLDDISLDVKGNKIKQVATISANNDEQLGDLISKAFIAVDETGVVMMETNDQPTTEIEVIEGLQYEEGFENQHFVTDKTKHIAELDDPVVLIIENKVDNIRKIQGVLENVIKNNKQLLIVADLDPQVVTALALNKVKGNIKVNVVKAPMHGVNRKEILDDLALVTGATVINENLGDDMDIIDVNLLGTCKKATSNAVETIIQVEEKSKEVTKLIKELKKLIDKTSNNNLKLRYEKRLSKLAGKVAIVKVGADSEVELKEKKDRVEDAICATKAAIKEGIVPGGGIALLNASQQIKSSSVGERVLLDAIKAPCKIILNNAGIDNYETPTEQGKGLNVVTGSYVDMVKSGIIDPLLVTKSALKNAASVATTIISTDCVINNVRV